MTTDDFELQPPTPGMPSESVLAELERGYREAKDYAEAYGDAVKAQADRHKLKPAALRKYIAARVGDKLSDLAEEPNDLETLLRGAA